METLDEKLAALFKNPAFGPVMSILDNLGPIVPNNPKVDKMYKSLRLIGIPQKEATEVIHELLD